MKIRQLRLSNYRAFPILDLQLDPGVNVIVGENTVGKSVLLQAIDWAGFLPIGQQLPASYWPDANPRGPLSLLLELKLENGEARILRNATSEKDKEPRDIAIDILAQSPSHLAEVKMYFLEAQSRTHTFVFDPHLSGVTTDNRGRVLGIPSTSLIKKMFLDSFYHFPEFRYRPASGEIAEEEALRTTEGIKLSAVLYRLQNSPIRKQRRLLDEIQESFHRLFPDLEFVVVKKQNLPTILVNRIGSDYEIPLTEVGAGIFEMLLVLTHIASERERIFLMDEPETHLHPHAQRLLEKELRKFSEANQIILTTHSPQFANFRHLSSVIVVRKTPSHSIASKLPKGYLGESEEAKASKLIWSEEKEFLFSRRVLLVEGPTEYGALPIIAEKLGKSFDENGVTVVSVGGHHFATFIKILLGLGIPFRVLCDADVLMEIRGHINYDGKKVMTSSLFEVAQHAGLLKSNQAKLLLELERKITSVTGDGPGGDTEVYKSDITEKLYALAKGLGFYVMYPDFEGVLAQGGKSQLLKEANNLYGKNKVLKGRYIAENIDNIPSALEKLISEIVMMWNTEEGSVEEPVFPS